jgi:hypothetical protein
MQYLEDMTMVQKLMDIHGKEIENDCMEVINLYFRIRESPYFATAEEEYNKRNK